MRPVRPQRGHVTGRIRCRVLQETVIDERSANLFDLNNCSSRPASHSKNAPTTGSFTDLPVAEMLRRSASETRGASARSSRLRRIILPSVPDRGVTEAISCERLGRQERSKCKTLYNRPAPAHRPYSAPKAPARGCPNTPSATERSHRALHGSRRGDCLNEQEFDSPSDVRQKAGTLALRPQQCQAARDTRKSSA